MLIEGKHICSDCSKEFDWYYQVPQHHTESLRGHWLPRNKVAVSPNLRNKDMTPINVSAYCPVFDCGYPNTFEVNYKEIKITK